MFFVIKKRHIVLVIFLIAIIVVSVFCATQIKTEYVYLVPKSEYLVVIDAGHGGVDGGCVGATTGVYESDLTLKYSKILATQLMKLNISSVLTRQDEKGLYEEGTTNLKKSDMQKRKHIIEQNKPNLVVSIHMNSYKLPSVKGLQTFYKKGNTSGKILGDIVQHELHSFVPYANETAKVGDFFIVNCTNIPAILVECGFLSNREEELKLIDKDYQIKICHSIASGIVKFLNEKKYGTN